MQEQTGKRGGTSRPFKRTKVERAQAKNGRAFEMGGKGRGVNGEHGGSGGEGGTKNITAPAETWQHVQKEKGWGGGLGQSRKKGVVTMWQKTRPYHLKLEKGRKKRGLIPNTVYQIKGGDHKGGS